MSDLLGLTGKAAFVIGGGLGIGEATSLALARAGCDVAVCDVDRERAEGVVAKIEALGRRGFAVAADVFDADGAVQTTQSVVDTFGRIDVLATIVGQAARNSAYDMGQDEWDFDFTRNLRYFFFYAQAAARGMRDGGAGGAIVAVSSLSGIQSAPNHAAYGAAKAGLISLVRSMAVEFAPDGIRVNAVAPGTVRTPRLSRGDAQAAWEQKIKDSLIPFRRLGTPAEIANAILFLASDMASYVTGHTLAVDGGYAAQNLLGPLPLIGEHGRKL